MPHGKLVGHRPRAGPTMYRGMTHYEFILALHTVLSSYKTHYELIVCFCELSTVSKNKHELIVCHCPVHGEVLSYLMDTEIGFC